MGAAISLTTTMIHLRTASLALAITAQGLFPSAVQALVLDAFNYSDTKAAALVWRAIDKSPPVFVPAPGRGVAFPCPFSEERDRVYWDRAVSLNLADFTSFDLELSCDRPEALRSLALYFKSGDGWYIWSKPLREAGRHRLTLRKDDFKTEGKPAGWHRIERIRISPWKGTAADATLALYSLEARRDSIFIVEATSSAPNTAERTAAQRTAQRWSRWLSQLGVSHAVIKDDDVVRGKLSAASVAVLPYNDAPPPAMMKALRAFAGRGGKLIVCYSSSAELAELMGVRLGKIEASNDRARWNAMLFPAANAWNVPPKVYQASWNILPAWPRADAGQIIAWWADANGTRSEDPAWIATERGLWMTHILLDDDMQNKQRMALGLLGRFAPAIWREAARRAVDSAGKIDNFSSFRDALAGIRRETEGRPSEARVKDLLAQAETLHADMLSFHHKAQFREAFERSESLRAVLTEAYGLAQPSRAGEFRGVWEHHGTGWYPGDWDRTCRILAESGVTAIFPNMLWTGLAHYPSKVVPLSHTTRKYGDQMKACIAAARKHGLQIHVWKVCWSVANAPPEFIAPLRKQGRLLKSAEGKELLWLDPAQKANADMELAAIRELIANYDIDGLHLDYIRYPPGADKRRKKPDAITQFVRRVRDEVRAIKPGINISAAVWGNYPDTIGSVGQDWGAWLRDGTVDFVCPMNYTADRFRFSALVENQMRLSNGRGRVYPGIGVTAAESQLRADEVLEQIAILRRMGAPGFMLFDLSHTLREDTLPILRRGATRPAD